MRRHKYLDFDVAFTRSFLPCAVLLALHGIWLPSQLDMECETSVTTDGETNRYALESDNLVQP
jgi:hypothetical protein